LYVSPSTGSLIPPEPEKWRNDICALCNLGSSSSLGQGSLKVYSPTPGYTPALSGHTDGAISHQAKKQKLSHTGSKVKSIRKHIGEKCPDPIEEIHLVGHVNEPTVTTLFSPEGEVCVHFQCGAWSAGVQESGGEGGLVCVDKSTATAGGVACSGCSNFGASVYCQVSGCDNVYHLPCGMSSGAIMDQHSKTLLCPNHVQKSPVMLPNVVCSVCNMFAPGTQLVWCVSCNAHFHAACIKPAITPSPVVRAGYQCNDCKTCQICNHPAEDLTCNVCNKAFHSSCAKPHGLNASKTEWKCRTCRVCGDCGARTPGNGMFSRWHSNFTVCDSCYQLRNKGLSCPVCQKAYR